MKRAAILVLSLALVVGFVAAMAEPAVGGTYSGYWKGTTGQSKVIKFHVTPKDTIDTMSATIHIPTDCGSVDLTLKHTFKPPLAIGSNGAFTYAAGETTWKGTFTGSKTSKGKLTSSYEDPVYGCSGTKTVTWSAKR